MYKKSIIKIISVVCALCIALYVIFTLYSNSEKGYYINSLGEKVKLCNEFSLLDITNICSDTKDFSVITEYVTLSGLPEGENVVRWEIGRGQELSDITSNVGNINYEYKGNIAYITIPKGYVDIQLVMYIKTTDLSKSLNNIMNYNKDYIIANDFGYSVILPDGTVEELPRRLSEDEKITLKEYFVWLKGL